MTRLTELPSLVVGTILDNAIGPIPDERPNSVVDTPGSVDNSELKDPSRKNGRIGKIDYSIFIPPENPIPVEEGRAAPTIYSPEVSEEILYEFLDIKQPVQLRVEKPPVRNFSHQVSIDIYPGTLNTIR